MNPQPVLPAWVDGAPWPEQTPTVGLPAQHADEQSALAVHPPVMNCCPLPVPTFLAPATLGVTARVIVTTKPELIGVQCYQGQLIGNSHR